MPTDVLRRMSSMSERLLDRPALMRTMFSRLDEQKSGTVPLKALLDIIPSHTTDALLEDLKDTYCWLSYDMDFPITQSEFVTAQLAMHIKASNEAVELYALEVAYSAGWPLDRHVALRKCFNLLDEDQSGFIEMYELKVQVGQAAPGETLNRAEGVLEMMDVNNDGKVSMDEYVSVFEVFSDFMSDTEFRSLYERLLQRGFAMLYDVDYTHPSGTSDYLQAHAMPLLRQAMQRVIQEAQHQRLLMAAGMPWVEGTYRAGQYAGQGWTPFRPIQVVADELVALRPPAPEPSAHAEPRDPHGAAGVPLKEYIAMSLEERLRVVYAQLDVLGSGSVAVADVSAAAFRILGLEEHGAHAAAEEARRMAQATLSRLGLDPGGSTSRDEAVAFLQGMLAAVPEADLSDMLRAYLSMRDYRYCETREERLLYLFQKLDLDHSGALTLDELRVLARRMAPSATDDEIAATLAFLDEDGSNTVSEEEFLTAMGALTEEGGMTDEAFNNTVLSILNDEPLDTALSELAPPALAEYVRSLPGNAKALQMRNSLVAGRLGEWSAQPVVLVDVRSAAEHAVSAIPGALHLPMQLAPERSGGKYKVAGDLAPLRAAVEQLSLPRGLPCTHPVAVVTCCLTGERGCAAAVELSEALGMPVYNMCGGLVHYYNSGGEVTDPLGRAVQALHLKPQGGSPETYDLLAPFVVRRCLFRSTHHG